MRGQRCSAWAVAYLNAGGRARGEQARARKTQREQPLADACSDNCHWRLQRQAHLQYSRW